jgi:hypothetical protein
MWLEASKMAFAIATSTAWMQLVGLATGKINHGTSCRAYLSQTLRQHALSLSNHAVLPPSFIA